MERTKNQQTYCVRGEITGHGLARALGRAHREKERDCVTLNEWGIIIYLLDVARVYVCVCVCVREREERKKTDRMCEEWVGEIGSGGKKEVFCGASLIAAFFIVFQRLREEQK